MGIIKMIKSLNRLVNRQLFKQTPFRAFSAKDDFFNQGEYVAYGQTSISEKIGEFELGRRVVNKTEGIHSVKVHRETLIQTEDQIRSKMNEISSIFDLDNTKVVREAQPMPE